jgi:alpha-1,2-mannosyltransferase
VHVAPPIPEEDRKVVPWIRWGGPVILAIALVLHVVAYRVWPVYALQIDTLVYRFGGIRVLQGLDLYSVGRNGASDDLLFTYTPFAAVSFMPLALISDHTAQALVLIVFPMLLVYVTARILKSFGLTAANGLWSLVALLVGVLLWLQPIRLSIQLGQINLLILSVVVADMLAPGRRKWAGVGIGLAAGIKLTPAVFIVYLVLIGRVRAALVATSTLVATVLLGFAVLPSESWRYWIGRAVADTKRIARDPSIGSSVQSLFQRLDYPAWLATLVVIALLMASLAVAVLAYRRGYLVLGIAIVGLASAAASPFSWSHHWVWFVPLIVHLGYRAYVLGSRLSAWTMWVFCAVFADWLISFAGQPPPSSILSVRLGGLWDDVIQSAYVFVLVIVLISTVVWLRQPSSTSDSTSADESVCATPAL